MKHLRYNLNYFQGTYLERQGYAMNNSRDLNSAEIWTWDLLNTKLGCCPVKHYVYADSEKISIQIFMIH
jgi:hypothetical protein